MKAFQRAFFVPALTALALLSTAPAFADPPKDCSKALEPPKADKRPRDSSISPSLFTNNQCTIEGEISIREVQPEDKNAKREFLRCEQTGNGLAYRQLSEAEVKKYIQCLKEQYEKKSTTPKKTKPKKKDSNSNEPRDSKFDIPF